LQGFCNADSVRAFIAFIGLFNAHDAYSTLKVEKDPVAAHLKTVAVRMADERLDVPGLRQVKQFAAHCQPDLLACVSVKLAQLAKGLGLPVDCVLVAMISKAYVSSMEALLFGHIIITAVPGVAWRRPVWGLPQSGAVSQRFKGFLCIWLFKEFARQYL
jgi:hypothetical protein